ncbi:MAG: hypothetical protein JXQ72_11550, partial [Anaerolineae bacterium]|nr:hypothetical protein [Anaerolineae bacterium]
VPWALELGDIRRAARQYVLLHDGTITLLPPFEAETHAALLAEIDTAADVLRANGDLLLRVQPVPENTAFAFVPRHESANGDSLAVFDGRAEVVSWRGPRTLSPTLDGGVEEIPVTYYIDWSARKSTNHFYTAFVQLQTQDHTALAGDEGPVWRWLYPPPLWGSGDVIATPYTLVIPGDLAPGAYRVVVGLYIARFTGMNQPVTAAAWGSAGEMATIDWIKVPQADPPALDPDRPVLDIVLGDMFALRQAAGERGTGGLVQVTLTWEGLADRPPVDATVFVHVRDADGTMIAQSDIRPWNGQYPTFIWDAGEIVQTTHTLDLGNIGDHDPADLQVVAGMYTFPGPDRLPVIQGGIAVPDALIDLGTLADLVGGYSP